VVNPVKPVILVVAIADYGKSIYYREGALEQVFRVHNIAERR
jgi:hypothetical protein